MLGVYARSNLGRSLSVTPERRRGECRSRGLHVSVKNFPHYRSVPKHLPQVVKRESSLLSRQINLPSKARSWIEQAITRFGKKQKCSTRRLVVFSTETLLLMRALWLAMEEQFAPQLHHCTASSRCLITGVRLARHQDPNSAVGDQLFNVSLVGETISDIQPVSEAISDDVIGGSVEVIDGKHCWLLPGWIDLQINDMEWLSKTAHVQQVTVDDHVRRVEDVLEYQARLGVTGLCLVRVASYL